LLLPRWGGRGSLVGTIFGLCLLLVGTLVAVRAETTSAASVSVKITSAPPATTTSTDATIAFEATGAKKTSCKLDGGDFGDCSSPARYSGLSAGTHEFVVKAQNDSTRDTAKATWQVVSSGATPTALSVTSSIANGSTLAGSVTWQATPSTSVTAVDFSIDGVVKWTERVAPYFFNGDGNKLDTKTLTDGSHVLKLVATAGNGAKAEVSATVQVANAPAAPTAPFTVTSSITNGSTLSGAVPWTATASQTVSSVAFSIDGVVKWTEITAPYVFNGDGKTLDTTTLTNGSHVLLVVATTSAGVKAQTSATVTVANGSAPTGPFSVISSITNGSTLSGSVPWQATPSQVVSAVDFYIDGALKWTEKITPYWFNGDGKTLDTKTLTNASHVLKLVATAAGGTTAQVSVTVTVANGSAPPAPSPAGSAGRVQYMAPKASGSMVSFIDNATSTQQSWMRSHWPRAVVVGGYWDPKISWFPNAWAYMDAYAIYNGSSLASAHPEWILKDSGGRKLFIPWDCSGSSCPQYAADIGNPAYRADYINRCKALIAKGYKGIFADDVNMDMNVGNGSGQQVAPIDPRTGSTMSDAAWKGYFAKFMEELRAAIPSAEIVHNAVWFAGGGSHDGSQPEVARQIRAANYYNLERGFLDGGLTGGTGIWSVYAYLRFIDAVHSAGRHVVLQSYANDTTSAEYNLAGYFLINDGRDYVSSTLGSLQSNWWRGYDTDLGDAKGGRYMWNGVWRRDFTRGFVLLNEPGSSTKSLSLGGSYKNIAGNTVTSVSLGGSRGAVLTAP
jgi:hypothetical protein